MAHTLIYCHVRPFAHTEPFPHKKKKYKHKKKRKFSSFTFSYPSHFICVCRLVQGWNGTRNTKKGTKIGVWRASRGKVQVCHSSCASQYKNATTRTTLLSTRQVQGRPSPPCSLLNKKGLGNWQDSLLKSDAMHSLHSLYVFFFLQLFTSLCLSIHVKEEQLWESATLHQEPKQDLHPLSLLSYGRRVISVLYSETPSLTLSFLWLRLRLAIPFRVFFVFNTSMCLSLAVSL